MSLQIRRGSTAQRLTITPLPGELIYDTTTGQIFIGDGATLGGIITTGLSLEDSKDAAASLLTSGTHSGISFVYNDDLDQIDATVNLPDITSYTGDFTGSVFADDSRLLIDGITGQIVGDINAKLAGDLNVNGNRIVGGNVTIAPTGLTLIGSSLINRSGNLYITRDNYSSLANQGFTFAQHHNTADAVNFVYYRTRGLSSSPSALQSGDSIVDIIFTGHNGVSPIAGAAISPIIEGSVSVGSLPTKLTFSTQNGTNLSIRAELSSQGVWKVNTIQGLTDTLSVAGNLFGDVKGSVYADDSARILDGTNGRITTPSVTLAEFLKLPVYTDDTARDTAIPSPEKGMVIFIETGTLPAATDQMQVHNGTSWVSL